MPILAQLTYVIKRLQNEAFYASLSPETVSLPADSNGGAVDYTNAKTFVKLFYDNKEIYPLYNNALDVELGGRNLLLNSNELVVNSDYPTKSYDLSELTKIGETYTYQIKGELAEGQIAWLFYNYDWLLIGMSFTDEKYDSIKGIYSGTFTATTATNRISVFSYPEAVGNSKIEWVKLEKGNKPTDWTPAPSEAIGTLITQNCSAVINASGEISVSNLTADAGYVDVPISYGKFNTTKRFTLAKAKKGADGKAVSAVDVEYARSTSNSVAPTTVGVGGTTVAWQTTSPAWVNGQYIWSRVKTTYTAGSPSYSSPVCITGAAGSLGATGRGISSIVEQFAISTSKVTAPTTWQATPPAWVYGQYIWTRSLITYTSGTPLTETTTPVVSSEWEAVNDISIGGVNLMRNGNFIEGQTNWNLNYNYGDTVPLFERLLSGTHVPEGVVAVGKVTSYGINHGIWQQHTDYDKLQLGKYYTVSCIAKSGSGATTLRFGIDGSTREVTLTTVWVRYMFTFKSTEHHNFIFYLNGAGVFYISNIQLEEGNQATAFKSGYLESVIQGSTDINGGLLLGHLLGAKDITGIVRSYMSGLSTKPTAFAAGVQNFGGASETRNIDIMHDGSAKFGKLEIDVLGTIFILDENGKRVFELNKNSLPQISTIISQSAIDTDYTSNSVSLSTTSSGTMSASANVTVAGSTLTIHISANTFAQVTAINNTATAELNIYLRKNGSATGQRLILSCKSDAYYTTTNYLPITDEGIPPQNPITIPRKLLSDTDNMTVDNIAFPNIEVGTYSLYYEFTRTVTGTGTRTTQGNITDCNMNVYYASDKAQLLIGKDGLFAYYGIDKYVSINRSDSTQPFVKMQGKVSIPALVYAATSPPSSISVGGPYAGTGHSRSSTIFTIHHTIGNTDYTAIITPTGGGTHDYYVFVKASTYIIISGTGTYDVTLIRTV